MALTHAVMFTLHDPADASEAAQRLRALGGRIPSLLSVAAGTSSSGSGPHVLLITTHADEEALRAYQGHPVHEELLSWIRPRIADRAVVDSADFG